MPMYTPSRASMAAVTLPPSGLARSAGRAFCGAALIESEYNHTENIARIFVTFRFPAGFRSRSSKTVQPRNLLPSDPRRRRFPHERLQR
jgi:hypothetical protein